MLCTRSVSSKMFKFNSVSVHLLCVVFLTSFVTKHRAEALQKHGPSPDFSRHIVVRPTLHHPRTKRELSSTRYTDGLHHPEVTLKVSTDGEDHVLDLRLNKDLISDNHVIKYQKNGKHVVHRPGKEELDICQYVGSIRDRPGSWAAVSTCDGVKGLIYDGTTAYHIHPTDGGLSSSHYIYDHRDVVKTHKCGYGDAANNTLFDLHKYQDGLHKHQAEKNIQLSRVSRHKRDTDQIQVRGPYNSNSLSRYVELVIVVDNREYRANDENLRTVHSQMKDVANIINSVYSQLNIFIALVGVVVWTERDEIDLVENGDQTLTNFLKYRKTVLLNDIPNDNAQLLTRQQFNNGVVGKGLKGPICTYEYSGAVSTNHSTVIGLVATTMAHEMGHNFGMEHDTEEDCTCPDEKCIMSPSSTSVTPTHWSSCSLKSLALAFERGMDYCLRNKPSSLFGSPTCGNGFVEAGEQCDCGPSQGDCDRCCDRGSCTLRGNATCSTGQCCDLQTCRPKAAGTVCRAADKQCDLTEYCSGHSEYCPRDVFKMDSTPCGNNEAYCYAGSCRTHTDQCQLLWGITGEMSHINCYNTVNIKGNKNGNCGYDRKKTVFINCTKEDALCGLLHCQHLNEQLQFGMESVSTLSHTFINDNGSIAACRTAMIDLGLGQVDPGLVPDGAKCGVNKMCLNQKCVAVELVRATLSAKRDSVCPSDCSGHGICNSEGHCHCEVGFSPPLCDSPGPGGSVDSGPAVNPNIQRNFMVAMYIIFLGVLPSILVLMFLLYYSRHSALCWTKPKKTSPSPRKSSLQLRITRGASKFASNFHNHNGQGPAPSINVNTVSSPDDMSSSLLKDNERSPVTPSNVNFFGNFKGFSLAPIDKNETEETPVPKKSAKITPVHRNGSTSQNLGIVKPVLRSAPPLPIVPDQSPKTSPNVKRVNSVVQNKIKSMIGENIDVSIAKNVINNPPPRPVISSPILEASTCTAKELISPLQGSKTLGPMRTAPSVPTVSPELPKRPLSMHSNNVLQKPLPEEPKKVKEGISLNRIASFLKHEKPKEKERTPVERSHSLPKNAHNQLKINKTDKVPLRNLQISNPILQKEIEFNVQTVPVVSDTEEDDSKSFVNRTQSMRGPAVSQKPFIHTFGSMRQTNVTRPSSVVGRPTAPPPPLPNDSTPIYKNPRPIEIKPTDYVDCIEEKKAPLAHIDEESSDNIYAIIEESPEKESKPLPGVPSIKTIPKVVPEAYNAPKSLKANSDSTESLGLLGEIVSEIQTRNFDSIYSTATLARKKKEKEKLMLDGKRDSTYLNTEYKTPESVYSNSGKSTASTTSSGYIAPSSINPPKFVTNDIEQKPKTENKEPSSPTLKINSKIPMVSRQVTPPGIRTTSTFRNVPSSPNTTKPFTINSPDLVSSCETKNTKPPDVINNNKPNEPPKVAVKPIVSVKPNEIKPPLKSAPPVEKKPITKTPPSLKPVNSNSNLQKLDKTPMNRVNSKVDSNVKAIADNLNKNKPKVVPKPSVSVQKTDNNIKPSAANNKLSSRPSNVASLQQKFENRKSIGRDLAGKK